MINANAYIIQIPQITLPHPLHPFFSLSFVPPFSAPLTTHYLFLFICVCLYAFSLSLSLSLSILSYSIYSKMHTYSYISIFSHITWNFKCELQLLRIWIMETRIWNNMVTFTNFCQSIYKMAVTPLIVLSQTTFLQLQLSWHCVSSVKSGPSKRVQVYLSEIQNSVKKFHILIILSHLDLFYWTGRSKIFLFKFFLIVRSTCCR